MAPRDRRGRNVTGGARLAEDGALDLGEVGVAAGDRRGLAEGGVGVLQAVAGEDADHGLGRRRALGRGQPVGEDARDRGGRGRLAEDALGEARRR